MFVGPVTSLLFSDLVATLVFPEVVRPSSLVSAAGGVVSASVLDQVERAAAGYSTVVEVEGSASESLSVVTRSVVKSVMYVRPAVVPSSKEPVLFVVVGGSSSAAVHALGPEVE